MKTGVELIAEERQEQISKHRYNSEHDRHHINGEIATAAMYAIGNRFQDVQPGWNEFESRVARKERKQRLIIAGALIAAEIDRLNALEAKIG